MAKKAKKASKKKSSSQSSSDGRRDYDADYKLCRNEMTSWFSRLTTTYNFTLAAGTGLLGLAALSLTQTNGLASLITTGLFANLALLICIAGTALLARTYSVMFRQGAYLKVMYKTSTWIANNRACWRTEAPEELHWVSAQTEPRSIISVLLGLSIGAGVLLAIKVIHVWNTTHEATRCLSILLCLIYLVMLTFQGIWSWRMRRTQSHPGKWEDVWAQHLNNTNRAD